MSASSLDLSPTAPDMSLSDLEGPSRRRAPPPTRSSRFTLLTQRAEHDDSNEADESYLDEEQLDEGQAEPSDEQLNEVETVSDAGLEDVPVDDVVEYVEATPKPVDKSVPPTSQSLRQDPIESLHPFTEDDRLRQQLFDMQRLNEAFSSYHIAVRAVREKQKNLISKVDRTKQLLDRYVAIVGQTEHNARLLLDPNWEGAQADEARILEEKRWEEQARMEREEARQLEQAEKERREAEAREATERAALAKGRGASRGVRGRATRSRTPTVSAGGRTTTPTSSASSSAPRGRGKFAIPSGLRAPTAGRALARGAGRGTRST